MRSRGLASRRLGGAIVLVSGLLFLQGSARAAGAVVTLSPTNARLQISGASLAEAIDALSRSANFKVTYEGPRPTGMIFNTDIDTPSVAQTLLRLLEGQSLNYAVVLDLSGKNVTLLMMLGPPARTASTAAGGSGGSGGGARSPQPFSPPRASRPEPTPDEDDAQEPEAQPSPSPSATPAPGAPAAPPGGPPALPPSPYQISPFAPRSPFGLTPAPAAPRPSPSPSP